MARLSPQMQLVLKSAAELQRLVPEAVLVGGAAAVLRAHHRDSFDHDHVVADLTARYEQVLEAIDQTDGWVTSVRASSPPLTILGSLGGIEAGLRELRRRVPLQTELVAIDAEHQVRVPTADETLRVKAYLIVQRNQTRDYLDVAALATSYGIEHSARVLADIDTYYSDRSDEPDSVLTALLQRLAEPSPRDIRVTRELASYKRLDPKWHRWDAVTAVCTELAEATIGVVDEEQS